MSTEGAEGAEGPEAAQAAAQATAAEAAERAAAVMAVRNAACASGAQLTFLGTGAAMPSKYRNVSAMLLQVPAPPEGYATRRQAEFYLSPRNLKGDAFLRERFAESADGWIDLSILATFPRMMALIPSAELPLPKSAVPRPAEAPSASEAGAEVAAAKAAEAEARAEVIASVLRDSTTVMLRRAPHGPWQVKPGGTGTGGAAADGTAAGGAAAGAPSAASAAGAAPKLGIMLDCGEGAMSALYRRFGEGVADVVRGVRLVWISHMHADHHLGLIALLEARTALLPSSPLLVVGPAALQNWLRAAAAALHVPIAFHFVHSSEAGKSPTVGAVLRHLGFEARDRPRSNRSRRDAPTRPLSVV